MERIGVFRNTRPSIQTRDLSATSSTLSAGLFESSQGAAPRASFMSAALEEGPALSAAVGRAPAPYLVNSTTLRVHFEVGGDASGARTPRTVDLPWDSVPESTMRSLAPFLLWGGNRISNLFLTLPDRPAGLLRPADLGLRSYGTVPLLLPSTRLVRLRARELLRTLADAHRVAHRELEEMRERVRIAHAAWIDEALFGPTDQPASALFTSPGSGELFRQLQGRYPRDARLAITPQVPTVVRRWWQMGDTQILPSRSPALHPDHLEGTLEGLRARFRERRGSILALEGLDQVLREMPLDSMVQLVQGAREEAERFGGKVWLSWDPTALTPHAVRQLSAGFQEVANKAPTIWTLSGAGEDARLVPALPLQIREALEGELPYPSLGEWLGTPDPDVDRFEGQLSLSFGRPVADTQSPVSSM